MTSRGLSAWFALGAAVLAILVALDRPHWFGLQPGTATARHQVVAHATSTASRSAPWLIKRTTTPGR